MRGCKPGGKWRGGDIAFFPRWPQRRALRTASEKVRNRSSFSTNVVYATPGTRVNRYIGRLLEARQTDLEMADLNFFTLKYKQAERERKVGDCGQQWQESYMWRPSPGLAGTVPPLSVLQGLWALAVPSGRQARPCGRQHCLRVSVSAVPPAPGRVLHQCRRARPPPRRLVWPHLPADNPAVSVAPHRSVGRFVVGRGRATEFCLFTSWPSVWGPHEPTAALH